MKLFIMSLFLAGFIILLVGCGASTSDIDATSGVSPVKDVPEIVNTATLVPATATPVVGTKEPTATPMPEVTPVVPTTKSIPKETPVVLTTTPISEATPVVPAATSKLKSIAAENPTATSELLPSNWGKILTEEPAIFPADDVEQSTTDLVKEWIQLAVDTWGNYGPLEIYIVGNDFDSAKKLEGEFCERHKNLDSKWRVDWDCAHEQYKIFTRYVTDGGAGVSTYIRNYIDYYFMTLTMGPKYPDPGENDYKVVTLHEYFHIYQHAHISDIEPNHDKSVRGAKMGGERNPWFSEGSAEFMAQLLYSRQPGVRENNLKDVMARKYETVDQYLSQDIRLEDLAYGDPVNAYDIGSWFIAYLVHQFGEDALVDGFYKDLDVLGFEESFTKHFTKPSNELVDEFNEFIAGGLEKSLEIIP